jgi:hypothetical protein
MPRPLVIGYDGSVDANRAVAAARTLDADHALVVSVWHPPPVTGTAGVPLGAAPVPPAPGEKERLEEAARRTADQAGRPVQDAG